MAKHCVIGAAGGTLWGVIAAGVFAAMRANVLPAPFEVALPLAIGMVFAYLPAVVAIGADTLLGRSSASFAEVMGLTVACGMTLGLAASLLISVAQKRHRSRRIRVDGP